MRPFLLSIRQVLTSQMRQLCAALAAPPPSRNDLHLSEFTTVHRSGAVTVSLGAFLQSPQGQQQLKQMKELHTFVLARAASRRQVG